MADLMNFSVTSVGQQINVKGDIVEGAQTIKTFGPNGTNFVAWFQQLPVSAQIEMVSSVCVPYMIRNLKGEWPFVIPSGRQTV